MSLYLIDANTIADLLTLQPSTLQHFQDAKSQGDVLGLCRPVEYEVLRGLYWRNAAAKLRQFDRSTSLFLSRIELEEADWHQAAHFYADMRRIGRQLSDVDLLLAALCVRLEAILVSSDKDFEALPVQRVSWREL